MSTYPFPDDYYRLRPDALARYNDVSASAFGTVTISLPNSRTYTVRDFHYPLGGGRYGMRLIPVSDDSAGHNPAGTRLSGSSIIDRCLRARMGLGAVDPIYAVVAYIRPEEHQLSLYDLLASTKLFYGYKHLGAYLGNGVTTHAPEDYHTESWCKRGHNVWGVRGYPATVFFVSLDGVDQSVLNRNGRIVDAILNKGVLAPVEFERMRCRVFTLNTALQFYRDWIRQSDYLTDYSWFMSCGDHKAVVINVMLNLPHNREAFLEIYGDDGYPLWCDFRKRFAAIVGREFRRDDETHFEPLWKKDRLSAKSIRPLSPPQHNSFDAAFLEHRLDSFKGVRPLPPGVGMAWPMETPIDLVTGFVSTYLSFISAGGVVSAAAIVRLASEISRRLGISESRYYDLVGPIVVRLLIADAKHNASQHADWTAKAKAMFLSIVVGPQSPGSHDARPSYYTLKLVEDCFSAVEQQLPNLAKDRSATPLAALTWLHSALDEVMTELHRQISDGQLVANFFATPSVFHRIASGDYPHSRFISVTAACTVVDHSELEICRDSIELGATATPEESRADSSIALRRAEPTMLNPGINDRPRAIVSRRCSVTRAAPAIQPDCSEPVLPLSGSEQHLVYALGRLGIDFETEARRNAFAQQMRRCSRVETNPLDERHLFDFLNARKVTEPWHLESVLWTLRLSETPQYVIRPEGPYARECYARLLQLFDEQVSNVSKRVVVPGTISGQLTLLNGRPIAVINPELSGLFAWPAAPQARRRGARVEPDSDAVSSLLARLDYEMQNAGLAPKDRALNFAGTRLLGYPASRDVVANRNLLDTIHVARSKVSRPTSDCWDVTLSFCDANKPVQVVRRLYVCTVDVSQVIPVTIGKAGCWVVRD